MINQHDRLKGISDMQLMDGKQVAKLLNCSEATISRLRSSGQLSFVRIGRQVRFRDSDLTDYLARHQQPAADIARR